MKKEKRYTIEIEGGHVSGDYEHLASFFGVDKRIVLRRLLRGWSIEQAVEVLPPPERKIIQVSEDVAEKVLKKTMEKKIPSRKNKKLVFVHATSHSGYWWLEEPKDEC